MEQISLRGRVPLIGMYTVDGLGFKTRRLLRQGLCYVSIFFFFLLPLVYENAI